MSLRYLIRYGSELHHSTERHPFYVDKFDVCRQVFYYDLLFLLGKFKVKMKRKVVFVEDVPQCVVIHQGLFGHTDWQSSCPSPLYEKCQNRVEEPV